MELALVAIFSIALGIGIGVFIASRVYWIHRVGTLRIDRSDPTEPPYIFLELNKGVGDISSKKNVILKVSNENYISQK